MNRTLITLPTLLALVGCGPDRRDPPAEAPGTIAGRVESQGEASGSSDAIVTVHRIEDDGNLSVASVGEVRTDADGRYTIDVDLEMDGETDLIVRAERTDGSVGEVVVGGGVWVDATTTAAPIDDETTAEAAAVVSLTASGAWEGASTAWIRAFVDADAGAAWTEADEADRDVVIDAWLAGVVAWTERAEEAGADVDAALDAMADAQADADTDADGDMNLDLAARIRAELLAAWTDAGASREELAFAAHAAAEAQLAVLTDAGEEATAASSVVTRIRAELAGELVADALTEIDGAEPPAEPEGDLLGQVDVLVHAAASGSGSGDLAGSLDDAWGDFGGAVWAELDATLSDQAMTATEAADDSVAEARAAFDATLASAGDAGDAGTTGTAAATAMVVFEDTAEADARAILTATSGLGTAEIEALVTVLVQLEAGGQS